MHDAATSCPGLCLGLAEAYFWCYIYSAVRIKKKGGVSKFKVRCSRFLYTLVIKDTEKAEKLRQSLPPGVLLFLIYSVGFARGLTWLATQPAIIDAGVESKRPCFHTLPV